MLYGVVAGPLTVHLRNFGVIQLKGLVQSTNYYQGKRQNTYLRVWLRGDQGRDQAVLVKTHDHFRFLKMLASKKHVIEDRSLAIHTVMTRECNVKGQMDT